MLVLVTGGKGYIGTRLCTELLRAGHRVRCLDLSRSRFTGEISVDEAARYDDTIGDVREPDDVLGALRGVDAVVHLAAIVGYPACDADPETARSTNIIGTTNLFASMTQRVPSVYLSTCSVYGYNETSSVDENCKPNPLTLYGRSKLEAEGAVLKRGGIVLRPVTAYGPSPRFRPELMPHEFIMHGLLGKTLRIFQPDAVRPLIHIEDICSAILFCLNNSKTMGGGIYNLGPCLGASSTKGELAKLIASLTDLRLEADLNARDPDGRSYRVDASKIHRAGLTLRKPLEVGLRETLAWMRSEISYGVAAQ